MPAFVKRLTLIAGFVIVLGVSLPGCGGENNDKTAIGDAPSANSGGAPKVDPNTYRNNKGNAGQTNPMQNKSYPRPR